MLFAQYQPAHRARLQALLETGEWQEVLAAPALLSQWKGERRVPPASPGQMSGAVEYLKKRNAERAKALLREGLTEEKALASALGDWRAAVDGPVCRDAHGTGREDPFPILFLGLVLTLDCSFQPRCLYCNQVWLPRRLGLAEWKALLAEAAHPTPPYVYLTGGEPLVLEEEIWGDDGLVAFATRLGCAVNLNTNGALITPRVALQLVKVGLARLHISLDSADPEVQAELFQGRERAEAVLRGLFNIQVARELLGAAHPQIHVNCVLTRRNLFQFPALLRFLLEIRRVPSAVGGKLSADPFFRDFAFHLIPVGGSQNAPLRPTAEEWKRFYAETWAEAEKAWREYQAALGVPEKERSLLTAHIPFASPFRRTDHRLSLDEYCEQAARGVYWRGALTERCHVAPSQAFVLPDGTQHWCGAHAIQRVAPLGNVREASLRQNIRRNVVHLDQFPATPCFNCAGATCVINQTMARKLREQVTEWLKV